MNRATMVAVAVLLAAGCGDDDDDDAAEETSGACEQWVEVEGAVQDLGEVDVLADGTVAWQTAADAVVQSLGELRGAVGESLDPEVEALSTATDELLTALQGLPADEGQAGSGLVAVGEAVQGVSAAAQDLGAEIESGCGS